MKNLRPDLDDTLRPEYRRSDFGEMVRGPRFAVAQLEFAELVNLLMGCISEDEGVDFTRYSIGKTLAGRAWRLNGLIQEHVRLLKTKARAS